MAGQGEMRPEVREALRLLLLEHPGKVLGTFLGFLVGLVVIFFGWVKAISLVLCMVVGYLIGLGIDSGEGVRGVFHRFLPPGSR